MKLTASDYDKLTRFFRDETQLSFRPGKRLLAWLDDHFDIRISNQLVQMAPQTKAQIREFLEQENPQFNVKLGLPQQANHMTMSKTMRDEKLGAIKPDDNTVLIKAYSGKIRLTSGDFVLPKEISLRVPVSQLQFADYDHVLVVENLDVFDALPNYDIPMSGKVLLVYRGHDKGTSKGLKTLLQQASSQCKTCWFPDLDPKGLELALAEEAIEQILSVDTESALDQLTVLNNTEKYIAQSQSAKRLVSSTYRDHPLVSFLLKHKLAIMQQHILSHHLPIKLYNS